MPSRVPHAAPAPQVTWSTTASGIRFPDERLDTKARGAIEKTLPALDALRASHPEHPQVTWIAGMILRKLGRLDDAAQLARRAFELDPTFATAVSLAYTLRERGDIDAARDAFEAAARLDPEDVSARCDLGAMPYRPDLRTLTAPQRAALHADEAVRGTVALAHMGCGYFSVLVIRGPRAGSVWADLRPAGLGVVPTHDSFTAWYRGWIEALSRGEPARIPVEPGRCSAPAALSDYLASWERQHALRPGALDEAGTRRARSC